jgi:hypothetical protein
LQQQQQQQAKSAVVNSTRTLAMPKIVECTGIVHKLSSRERTSCGVSVRWRISRRPPNILQASSFSNCCSSALC